MQHVDELYETGPALDYLTPLKDSRDIAGHVWRSCFYKQISEFRGALKRHSAKLAAILSADKRAPLGSDPGAVQREQVHIARLTQGLLGFLSDSISYFQQIVHGVSKLRCVVRLAGVPDCDCGHAAGRAGTHRHRARGGVAAPLLRRHGMSLPAVSRRLVQVRCPSAFHPLTSHFVLNLIHEPRRRDCRYREMYSERTQKDFAEAMRYYERAALLEPASGNAQNQVAHPSLPHSSPASVNLQLLMLRTKPAGGASHVLRGGMRRCVSPLQEHLVRGALLWRVREPLRPPRQERCRRVRPCSRRPEWKVLCQTRRGCAAAGLPHSLSASSRRPLRLQYAHAQVLCPLTQFPAVQCPHGWVSATATALGADA